MRQHMATKVIHVPCESLVDWLVFVDGVRIDGKEWRVDMIDRGLGVVHLTDDDCGAGRSPAIIRVQSDAGWVIDA